MEEWEIELKQQLSNVSTKAKSSSDNWEEELRKQVSSVLPSEKNKINKTLIFLVLLIFLSIAVIFVFNHKTNNSLVNLFKQDHQKTEEKIEEIIEEEKPNEFVLLKEQIKSLEEDRDKLSANCKKQAQQICLLGVLLNENFLIVRDGYEKNDMILLNRDWKIKKFPKHIKLEKSDIEFLEKHKEN